MVRKTTEAISQRSQDIYQKLFSHSRDAIFIIDPARDAILEANPRASAMLGYPLEELLNTPISAIHPDEMPKLKAFARSVLKEGQGWTNELTCTTKTGRCLPAEISASSVEVDGRPCIIALVRDVSDRRRAEEALRESEERYRKVFQSSNDAIFITDDENDEIMDANPRACTMLEYPKEDLMKTPISTIHQHELPQVMEFAQLVSKSGKGWTNQLSCQTRTGRILPCEISASKIDIGGRACTISVVRDITERREAEKTLQELAVLEERNRLARELHDSLAQGLTGIIWQLNVAERTLDVGEAQALESINKARGLAKESLQEVRRSVWDLRSGPLQGLSLAEALRQETDKAASAGGFQLSFDVSGQERVLPTGIEASIFRICQEALTNIRKHAQATQVDVVLIYEEPSVKLCVRDDGVGFDVDSPITADEETRGFGLISMRERARLLGGQLSVKSEPGQGTSVEAILPLS